MKQKIAITLDRELLSFIDRQAQGNRSDYLNSLIAQERRKILEAEIIAALQADSQDPEYQAEIAEWDRLAGDGIGSIPLFNPHPKSLSLREKDFESGSLLPQGEGLGMRAVNLRKNKWDAPDGIDA